MADIFIEKSSSQSLVKSKLSLNISWQNFVLPLAVFLVALLPRLLSLDTFLTADEDDQLVFAHLFLKSVWKGDFTGVLVLGYPGVPTLVLGTLGVGLRYLLHYSGWLPLPWVTAGLIPTINQVAGQYGVFAYPLDMIAWVRGPMVIVASLSVMGIYLMARRLVDERLALLGTLIIAFDPFFLAHSRILHVDAPLAYFMFLSFLAFLLFLDKGTWKWLLLSGFFGGLAGLSKTPAALLGPILVISGLIYALLPPPELPHSVRWKRLVMALLGWGVFRGLSADVLDEI